MSLHDASATIKDMCSCSPGCELTEWIEIEGIRPDELEHIAGYRSCIGQAYARHQVLLDNMKHH